MDDTAPVLVAYASRHEATREIAAAIAERLAHHGVPTATRDIAQVADLAPYGAVVLGSAVYIGRWLKPARAFADTHAAALRDRRRRAPPLRGTPRQARPRPARTHRHLGRRRPRGRLP